MEYIIYAQVGNAEDYTWDIVDRTTELDYALRAIKQGARVYKQTDRYHVICHDWVFDEDTILATFFSKPAAQDYIDGIVKDDHDLCYYTITTEEIPLFLPSSDDIDDLPF